MRTIEMILMTKSSKYGAYCTAGFDCESGAWVRLVSDDEETHGALDDDMLYDAAARRHADVLDKIRVEIAADVPSAVQRENVLVDGTGKIRIVKRVSLAEAMRLHGCEVREGLFGSYRYIAEGNVEALGHSLEWVQVENLHLYTMIGSSGKPKYKADFEYLGRKYEQFAMTDPQYYNKGERFIPKAALALSISDDEWSRANGHYIYVARIFALKRTRKLRKIVWRKALAVLLVGIGMLALGAALMGTEKVYVSPYSGARYHGTRQCTALTNPNASDSMPAWLARMIYKPCAQCIGQEK